MILGLAVLVLFWDKGPDTAPALRSAGITHIAVPTESVSKWSGLEGITAEALDPSTLAKIPTPSIQRGIYDANATGVPYLIASGWKIQRDPAKKYLYEAPGRKAAVAAAEAASWGATAYIHTDEKGLPWFAGIMQALNAMPAGGGSPLANIGLVDDGSSQVGELANLLARYNLLFQYVAKPDPKLDLNVRIGSEQYPAAEAKNPHDLAIRIRGDLGDAKRDLRIYGSQVVVGRLVKSPEGLRVHLVNYGDRSIEGVRVRVRGAYDHSRIVESGISSPKLLDYTVDQDGTEFTVAVLDAYAEVELTR